MKKSGGFSLLSFVWAVVSGVHFTAMAASNAVPSPLFQVGFGEENISTSQILPMGGYGIYFDIIHPPRKNTAGTHDPIFASAIALKGESGKTILFVTLDLVGLSSESVSRIEKKIALESSEALAGTIISSSHTHQSPDTMGLWGALPYRTGRDPQYMNFMEDRAALAGIQALRSLRDAHLNVAESIKENSSSKKPDPRRRDDAVVVLVATDPTGKVLGSLTQWSAHPTVLSGKNNTLSADYVGAFRHFMKERYKGTHLFLNGAVGNTYVLKDVPERPDPFQAARDADEGGYGIMAEVGFDLAQIAHDAISNAVPLKSNAVSFKKEEVSLPIENWLFKLASKNGIVEKQIDPSGHTKTSVAVFSIGDVKGAAIPGEMFCSGAQTIRSLLKKHGAGVTLLAGLANDWLGYLMASDEYDSVEYRYHRTLSPGRNSNEILVGAIERALDKQ